MQNYKNFPYLCRKFIDMKKLYIFALLLLAIIPAKAEVLLVEDFDYPISELLTNHDWFTQWGAASQIMTTSSLGMEGYAGCGVGSAALLDQKTTQPLHRALTKEITSGDVYVSFLLQPKWAENNAYFLALRDKITDNYTFNMNGRVYIDEYGKVGLSFGKGKESCKQYSTPLKEDKIYLIVLKYHIEPGNNNDQAYLYILNQFTANEPPQPSIGPLSNSAQPDIFPASVQLHCDHGISPWITIDAIRVATTWQEAVQPGTCPQDTYLNPDNDWDTTTNLNTTLTPTHKARKTFENGNIYIIHNNQKYTILGTKL